LINDSTVPLLQNKTIKKSIFNGIFQKQGGGAAF
jgi:hypothetical protein